uniref:Uncharacterized protein n=1 Tax=Bionectria ochroleuca TaxID=29856 RepID=A0A8H7TP43_BIOOC
MFLSFFSGDGDMGDGAASVWELDGRIRLDRSGRQASDKKTDTYNVYFQQIGHASLGRVSVFQSSPDNDDGVPNGEPLRTAEWHIYTTQRSAEWEMVCIHGNLRPWALANDRAETRQGISGLQARISEKSTEIVLCAIQLLGYNGNHLCHSGLCA